MLQQAHKVLKDIDAGQSFEEAAKKNGQSPYRDNSGNWGVMVSKKKNLILFFFQVLILKSHPLTPNQQVLFVDQEH